MVRDMVTEATAPGPERIVFAERVWQSASALAEDARMARGVRAVAHALGAQKNLSVADVRRVVEEAQQVEDVDD
jgi:hypothetical protein